MGNKCFKSLCESAHAYEKVSNAAELTDALPNLIDLQEMVKGMSDLVQTGKKAIAALSEKCSAYALKHPGCFDDGLTQKEKNVETGDITINDVVYHFVSGVDGYRRSEKGNLSQDFLKSLPAEWVRSKLEIDATGIDRGGFTDEELAERGLVRKQKNTWEAAAGV